jgi:hypothetical protein
MKMNSRSGRRLTFTMKVMLTEILPCFKQLQFEGVTSTDSHIVITAVATPPTAACPLYQQPSRWVHSRYQRAVADLPLGGTDVVLQIRARKFFLLRALLCAAHLHGAHRSVRRARPPGTGSSRRARRGTPRAGQGQVKCPYFESGTLARLCRVKTRA